MFAGMGGQARARVDRKTAKESKDLAQTNSQYQGAIEKARALQAQIATEAAKVRSLTQALQSSAVGAQRQILARDLAGANARLVLLKEQLNRTDAGLTSALEKQSIQVGAGWTVPGAVVIGVGAAFCCTLLLIILSCRHQTNRRR